MDVAPVQIRVLVQGTEMYPVFYFIENCVFHKAKKILCPADLPYGHGDGQTENGHRRRTEKAVFLFKECGVMLHLLRTRAELTAISRLRKTV